MIMETRYGRMKNNDILKNIAEKKNFSDKVLSWLLKNDEYLTTNNEYVEYHKDITSLDPEITKINHVNIPPKVNNSKLRESSEESSVETAKYILSNQKTKRKRQSTNIRVKVKQLNSINEASKHAKSTSDNNGYSVKNSRRKTNNPVEEKCNVSQNVDSSKQDSEKKTTSRTRKKVGTIVVEESKFNSNTSRESKVKLKKRRLKRQLKCDSSTVSQKYNLKTYKRNLTVCPWDMD